MENQDPVVVGRVSVLRRKTSPEGAIVRPLMRSASRSPQNVAATEGRAKFATGCGGGYFGGGGGFNPGGGGTMQGMGTNIYSPHLSTDFLELPQNLTEQRSYFRHFYKYHPFVARAIDLHTELPLSKLRLSAPRGKDPKLNEYIYKFFEDWTQRVHLLERLIEMTREHYVVGDAFVFAQEDPVEIPEGFAETEKVPLLNADGQFVYTDIAIPDKDKERLKREYRQKHYKGWKQLSLLPAEQVNVQKLSYTNTTLLELIPDTHTKELVRQAYEMQDPNAQAQVQDIPLDIVEIMLSDQNILLGTDPSEGSFCYQFSRNKPSYATHGISLIERCIQWLVHEDKLRQAQASIASRAMTPKRLVWAEDLSVADVEDLRDQVDLALLDPDYTIVTNYQVNWEEISARDRLLDLGSEFDIVERRLFAGLAVTESMLTGESTYSGERINVEMINTQYMLYRERLQNYVEQMLFKPIAIKKGFIEYDEYGNEVILYPRVSFTRLALRDNRDTFDSMFNLYQKGSLPVSYILELLNLDATMVYEQLKEDLFTLNDATFNDVLRSVYSDVGRKIAEETDAFDRIAQNMNLNKTEPPSEDGGRF